MISTYNTGLHPEMQPTETVIIVGHRDAVETSRVEGLEVSTEVKSRIPVYMDGTLLRNVRKRPASKRHIP
jgi:hypothetical protein